MKAYLFLSFSLLLGIVACKDSSVNSGPTGGLSPAVEFMVGNEYNMKSSFFMPGLPLVESYQTTTILRDTVLKGNSYYILSSGDILRSTDLAVFRWRDTSETEYYSFSVTVGDTIDAVDRRVVVQSITTDSVLGRRETVVNVSNSTTSFFASYSTKFGVIRTQDSPGGMMSSRSLSGAKINSVTYGSL